MFPQTRLRRLRKNSSMRALFAETQLTPQNFIWPLFITEGKGKIEPIPSLPGVARYSADEVAKAAKEASKLGIKSVLLFGVPSASEKDECASKSFDDNGLVPQAIRAIKDQSPETVVMTDVCLCAYTNHGHCGVLAENGEILNDESLELLSSMALCHARNGADVVAPSDMMDGRVQAIRNTLDGSSFADVAIMSYAAKYASAFYGPFRDAAHSAPSCGDRKSYQMDSANAREALREMQSDVEEGADILMVKPALAYLDVISQAKQRFDLPIAAYHVSGEYAMVKAAAEKGWLDGERAMLESLMAIKRAGADVIISYYAKEFAEKFS